MKVIVFTCVNSTTNVKSYALSTTSKRFNCDLPHRRPVIVEEMHPLGKKVPLSPEIVQVPSKCSGNNNPAHFHYFVVCFLCL